MMRQPNQNFFDGLPPTGRVTKWFCIATVVISLVGSLTQRQFGLGVDNLVFTVDGVLDLELWRLITYPFAYHQPFGLVLGVFIFWLFGKLYEQRWGENNFFKFIALSGVGAAGLAIPLSYLVNFMLPFNDYGAASGASPIIDAILIHMAIMEPNSKILAGFVLPMRTKTLIYCVLGFDIITGIMTGAAGLSTTLGGIVMGYLLTTGNWRPARVKAEWEVRTGPKRRNLYVVKPPDQTLH